MVSCAKDDLGTCCGKCIDMTNVLAVIPCYGRFKLLDQTVNRLVNKNKVKVLLIGHEPEVQNIATKYSQHFAFYKNTKLGEKWNFGFKEAKKYNPDAVLFVGSSDWVEDDWVSKTMPYLTEYEMVGTLGCYLLDINTLKGKRLVHWPGYGKGLRQEEPIGIGRMISKKALDRMNWQPFDPNKDNSMDWQMWQKTKKVKIIEAVSMAISTNLWPNKHQFEEHWKGLLRSNKILNFDEFLSKNFPEALNIF